MVAAATDSKYDGLFLYPFNFKISNFFKTAPNATYNYAYPLLSKICFGLSVDKADKRCYKEDVQKHLVDTTKERLEKNGFKIPLMSM